MDVRIEDLEFGYNENRKVLEGVFLKIDGPQLISIIGPNGVGKSTLIHCMNKILNPTGGVVQIEGKDVRDYSVRELAKQMGYVPHATGDSFPMTVMDTVLMGKYPHAGKKVTNADVEEVYGILKLLGIEHLAMRSFDQLSAGQHQKVALARGLAQQPKILLLDEPTSNLDIKHQMDVSRILKEMTEERDMVVVMISHDLNIASKYSDYMIMLHGGGIYAIGTPEEVITPKNIKTVYGVESSVILDEGRPHVILRDGLFKEEEHRVNDGVICTR
ncbi:MAG: ABC transporter ATP-binding protein [Candidatus Methanomethylophilaceae archaeon]|nr:ABC transporter ATP-binding protein [Candidatus Methanomethylophilaceae archaeon]